MYQQIHNAFLPWFNPWVSCLVFYESKENEDIVYFELNHWIPGEFYPDEAPFDAWMDDESLNFATDDFVKENELCIVMQIVDMSLNFCITAKRDWVMKNCPCILEEKNRKFLRFRNDDGEVIGQFGDIFFEYNKKHIGIKYSELN